MARQSFAGKVVWITGASSGIGKSLALAFHRAGAKLILSARRTEALDEVRRECGTGADVIPDRKTTVPEWTLMADVNGMFAPAAGSVPDKWTYSKSGPASQAVSSTAITALRTSFDSNIMNNFFDNMRLVHSLFDIADG